MVAKPNYDILLSEVTDTVILHYRNWLSGHPDEEIYAYVIYAPPLVSHISTSVLTEQGLRQVASVYKNTHKYTGSLQQLENELRWSAADSSYIGDYQYLFDSVNHRLAGMMSYSDSLDVSDPAFDMHINMLYSILVAALNHLRQNALGGNDWPLLYVDFGDMSDEERLRFIEQCNSPARVKWYTLSIELAR